MEKIIPFIGPPNQRATGTNDRRFVNALFEVIPDPAQKTQDVYCFKRPGLANNTQPPGGAAAGRGIYAWGTTGNVYTVFDNKIYSGTTDLGVTLAASAGRVWFAETPASASEQLLVVSDGTDNYNITTSDTVNQIDEADNANYPQNNLGPIFYLNTRLFQAQSDGDIWNTNLNIYSTWPVSGVTRAARHGDALEAILLQRDQCLAFGKNSIEFFYDAGKPVASPLLRVERNALDFGMASRATLAWSGQTALFVGENASRGDGGRAVWIVQALERIEDISPPVINRFLKDEGQSISSATCWMERIAGQLIYCINLVSANRTFVYNVDNGTWTEWEASGGGAFGGAYATSLNGTIYIQDASNGRVYTISPATYQDSGSNFTVTIQTEGLSFGTDKRKRQSELAILGDTSGGTLSVAWSDDDYANFTSSRPIDMSFIQKRLRRLGSFRERAYRYTYTHDSSFRIQAARHVFDVGAS